jgi:hypothetical protein
VFLRISECSVATCALLQLLPTVQHVTYTSTHGYEPNNSALPAWSSNRVRNRTCPVLAHALNVVKFGIRQFVLVATFGSPVEENPCPATVPLAKSPSNEPVSSNLPAEASDANDDHHSSTSELRLPSKEPWTLPRTKDKVQSSARKVSNPSENPGGLLKIRNGNTSSYCRCLTEFFYHGVVFACACADAIL